MNSISNRTLRKTIHVLVWLGIFFLPHIIGYFTHSDNLKFDFGALIMPFQALSLFYLNYLYLINKLLFKKKVWQFLTTNLLIVIALSIIITVIFSYIIPTDHPPFKGDGNNLFMLFRTMVNVATQTLVIGLSVAIKMTNKWYEARQRVQELEQANTQAELQQLKSQLNPHFLFNSLNNIYALIAFDPEKAQLSLHNLCDLLRYQLYESNRETIPLEHEIEFVQSYCDLMKLRLPKHVQLEVELPQDIFGITIAPLLFISIVENAFKHGISQNKPSEIQIRISIFDRTLLCVVRNSDHPKPDNDHSGSGIGLENLRRRLELLYPEAHKFTTERQDNEFIAQLKINL